MKKILFLFIFIIFSSLNAFATSDDVILEFNETFQKQTLDIKTDISKSKIAITDEEITPIIPKNNFEIADSTTTNSKLFNSISKTIHEINNQEIENTNIISPLFKEQLTKNFENGPLESIHTWGVFQSNFETTTPDEGNGYAKFNPSLVNILFDGKFKGGNENFRLMLDPSHQHNRGFFNQFVQDAYFETHRIPNHTILIGNSRTGTGYEGAQSPYTLPFLFRSQISRNLANIRKVGLRVKGDYSLIDYDLGGYSSDTFFTEFLPGVEFDGWVNIKPLNKTNMKYGKLTTGGGIVTGRRHSTDYFVGGTYIGYEYKKFWTKMEYAVSNGSNGGSGLTSKHANGWYLTVGYKLSKKLELVARYDEFSPDKTIKHNKQREYSSGVNYYIKGQALKLILNYIFCQNDLKPNSHRILVGIQIAV